MRTGPPIVLAELCHIRTPSLVKAWIEDRPPWLHLATEEATVVLPPNDLDPGELATIRLASHRGADLILMDDHDAVRFTREQMGIAVLGTLGILDRAAELGHVELSGAIGRLRSTNFRAPPELANTLLAKHRAG